MNQFILQKCMQSTLICLWIIASCSITQAALVDRGNGLIYDEEQDITWLQNANLSGQTFNWQDAVVWADTLVFGGFDDWRLPIVDETFTECSAFNCLNGELAHLFYIGLDGTANQDLIGNQGHFFDIQRAYWTGSLKNSDFAFYTLFSNPAAGVQSFGDKNNPFLSAWAVRDGNVPPATVPSPSAALLMGTGLIGLVGWRWRSMKTV